MADPVRLLIGTKKGAWTLTSDPKRRTWTLSEPIYFGHIVFHFVQDPRDPRRMVIAARAGHLGPTLYVSGNGGRKWKESTRPPAFPKGGEGLVVDHTFAVIPGHATEPGVWYAGASPQGLFRSEDHGMTWTGVDGFNANPMRAEWVGPKENAPPDGARLHSVAIDPRDPKHMYIAMSSGGVFETTDRGATWSPLNRGCAADFIPTPDPEFGHDPHCLRLHPLRPDRLYQQNHCGLYRMERATGVWERIGRKLPKKIGDIGFPVVLHPRDPDTLWVFPMDGTEVWPRTSPGGQPAAYATRNAGRTWTRLDAGLPDRHAWFTVFRQAMTVDSGDPVGVYFGNTAGEIWGSRDEGAKWSCLARHLPRIHSVEAAR